MVRRVAVVALVSCLAATSITGLQLIPERTQVTYMNPLYVECVNVSTGRYARGGTVLSSLHAVIKHAWGNNITVEAVMYEFLSNDYRRSFVQLKGKVCDIMEFPILNELLRQTDIVNVTCPYPAGAYHLTNMTSPGSLVPAGFPFRKGRVNLEITLTEDRRTRIAAGLTYFEIRGQGKNKE